MMVADNKVNAYAFGVSNLVDCLDTAIENDNQFHTCFQSVVYSFFAHPITLFIAVGDVIIHIGIELLQKLVHQCYGRASVNVVVAINHNTLLASHRIIQPINSHIHILHQERVDEIAQLRAEETLCGWLSGDATTYQDLR